jgi:hypothetical protein
LALLAERRARYEEILGQATIISDALTNQGTILTEHESPSPRLLAFIRQAYPIEQDHDSGSRSDPEFEPLWALGRTVESANRSLERVLRPVHLIAPADVAATFPALYGRVVTTASDAQEESTRHGTAVAAFTEGCRVDLAGVSPAKKDRR